jgi:peptidoglycan/LPS O-acetylase OafA/YrhL
MKLLLHTLRKDVRRLWPAVLVSLALLAILALATVGASTP